MNEIDFDIELSNTMLKDLEPATKEKLGGIIVGEGLNITENGVLSSSTVSGTTDYSEMTNKPSINSVELNGNKTLDDLGIQAKGNYLLEETDPTVPDHVKNITEADIKNWDGKSSFSGAYSDLSGKPSIPSKTSDLTDRKSVV